MAVASYKSPVSPPPFAAQFAEVTVDTRDRARSGWTRLVMAVDSGVIVNPLTASGQIEGGMTQALGYAVCEEMLYDESGNARERDLWRLSHLPRPRDAGPGDDLRRDLRAIPPLRGQGRGGDPDGWRGAGGGQRDAGCLRGERQRHSDHPRAPVAGDAAQENNKPG